MDGCKYLGIDAPQMDAAWSKAKDAKKLVKFGGGFYCGLVEVAGKEPVYSSFHYCLERELHGIFLKINGAKVSPRLVSITFIINSK